MFETFPRMSAEVAIFICVFCFLKTCGLRTTLATLKCAHCVCLIVHVCFDRCCARVIVLHAYRFCVFCFLPGPQQKRCWVWPPGGRKSKHKQRPGAGRRHANATSPTAYKKEWRHADVHGTHRTNKTAARQQNMRRSSMRIERLPQLQQLALCGNKLDIAQSARCVETL